jgi:transposase
MSKPFEVEVGILPSRREGVPEEAPMLTHEDVQLLLQLQHKGWGIKKIARELKLHNNTVRRYLKMGHWQPHKGHPMPTKLADHKDWLLEADRIHGGNAVVVLRELKARHPELEVSLRTLQRQLCAWRPVVEPAPLVRFETPPGDQLQADFGAKLVRIHAQPVKVHLAVLTLGFSRRCFVQAFEHERQHHWLQAIENALRHFGGAPRTLLVDNARALVVEHRPDQDLLRFHPTFLDFCTFWGMTPRACRPYRPQTKGKVERGVGYVKSNALAGYEFDHWEHLHSHLRQWTTQVADLRIHGTTLERPIDRFERHEANALQPIQPQRSYAQLQHVRRRVNPEACVELERHSYSVPARCIGRTVTVNLSAFEVVIRDGEHEVARHARCTASGPQRSILPEHRVGQPRPLQDLPCAPPHPPLSSTLQRPLSEYAALIEMEEAS